jgi:hypothetical protein
VKDRVKLFESGEFKRPIIRPKHYKKKNGHTDNNNTYVGSSRGRWRSPLKDGEDPWQPTLLTTMKPTGIAQDNDQASSGRSDTSSLTSVDRSDASSKAQDSQSKATTVAQNNRTNQTKEDTMPRIPEEQQIQSRSLDQMHSKEEDLMSSVVSLIRMIPSFSSKSKDDPPSNSRSVVASTGSKSGNRGVVVETVESGSSSSEDDDDEASSVALNPIHDEQNTTVGQSSSFIDLLSSFSFASDKPTKGFIQRMLSSQAEDDAEAELKMEQMEKERKAAKARAAQLEREKMDLEERMWFKEAAELEAIEKERAIQVKKEKEDEAQKAAEEKINTFVEPKQEAEAKAKAEVEDQAREETERPTEELEELKAQEASVLAAKRKKIEEEEEKQKMEGNAPTQSYNKKVVTRAGANDKHEEGIGVPVDVQKDPVVVQKEEKSIETNSRASSSSKKSKNSRSSVSIASKLRQAAKNRGKIYNPQPTRRLKSSPKKPPSHSSKHIDRANIVENGLNVISADESTAGNTYYDDVSRMTDDSSRISQISYSSSYEAAFLKNKHRHGGLCGNLEQINEEEYERIKNSRPTKRRSDIDDSKPKKDKKKESDRKADGNDSNIWSMEGIMKTFGM